MKKIIFVILFMLFFISINSYNGTVIENTYYNCWRTNVSVGQSIVDTNIPYKIHMTRIIVTGEDAGTVGIFLNNSCIRIYGYKKNGIKGEIFNPSILIDSGSSFKVILLGANPAYHSVCIVGTF